MCSFDAPSRNDMKRNTWRIPRIWLTLLCHSPFMGVRRTSFIDDKASSLSDKGSRESASQSKHLLYTPLLDGHIIWSGRRRRAAVERLSYQCGPCQMPIWGRLVSSLLLCCVTLLCKETNPRPHMPELLPSSPSKLNRSIPTRTVDKRLKTRHK